MINGKWKRKAYFGIFSILSQINKVIPKEKEQIVFFSTSWLSDNSEALFRYLLTNHYNEKYKITCIVKDPKDYERYRDYKNINFCGLSKAVWMLMRARYIFYHNEILALMPSEKQISIDFWHATTVKKINKMIDPDYRYDFFTYITATSELFRPVFAKAFGCELSRVIINGHPRNDYLFGNTEVLRAWGIEKQQYKKLFIWMPTYRKNRKICDTEDQYLTETGLPVLNTGCEIERLNSYLKEKECFLLIKIHPVQLRDYAQYNNLSNIRYLFEEEFQQKNIPFYQLLAEMDALITDYSSVCFDFLLLDRPMAFTLDDIESYRKKRGFVFDDPITFMPGNLLYSLDDFYCFIQMCIEEKDYYKEKRRDVNEKVNYYKDNLNCRRILEFVGID